MPPTALYLMALAVWIPAAVIVWIVAGAMLISPGTRRMAWPLSLAMAATFPGVFLFQIVAAPFVGGIMWAAWLLWGVLEPGRPGVTTNLLVIGIFISAAFLSFVLMLAMSVLGFYEGWRIAWSCAEGQSLRDAIKQGLSARLIRYVAQWRRSPSPNPSQ